MAGRNFSRSLLLGISEMARDRLVLTDRHRRLPAVGQPDSSPSQLHLPEPRISARHFIDMGLRPSAAERLLMCFLKFVARYRGIFEFYFSRATQAGCHLPPTCYSDTFVIQYERTIQSWESQIMFTVQAWLCRAEFPSPELRVRCMDIHMGDTVKNGILSELGFQVTPLAPGSTGTTHGVMTLRLEEKECQKDGTRSTKRAKPCLTLTVSPATSPMADSKFLNGAVPSTCFPARYPPPPGESHTPPQRTFVTSFARAATHHSENPLATDGTDTLPFTSLFGQMSLSSPSLEVGTRTQKSPKGRPRNPKSSKTDPLPPLLSPIVVNASRLSCENQPTAKSIPIARRRRIAPLPNRHNKSAASSLSTNMPSSATNDPLLSVTSRIPSTQESVVGKSPLGHVNALSMVLCPHSTPNAQVAAEISSPPSPKSVMPTRKLISLSRPARPKPQGTTSAERMVPPPTLPGWNVSSRPVSRTPSLVSDNFSGIESASSSDELDTPPSSPPSSLHATSVRGTMTNGTSISSKPTGSNLPPKPSLKDGTLPNQMNQSLHTYLTRAVSGQGRPLTFTFNA